MEYILKKTMLLCLHDSAVFQRHLIEITAEPQTILEEDEAPRCDDDIDQTITHDSVKKPVMDSQNDDKSSKKSYVREPHMMMSTKTRKVEKESACTHEERIRKDWCNILNPMSAECANEPFVFLKLNHKN